MGTALSDPGNTCFGSPFSDVQNGERHRGEKGRWDTEYGDDWDAEYGEDWESQID